MLVWALYTQRQTQQAYYRARNSGTAWRLERGGRGRGRESVESKFFAGQVKDFIKCLNFEREIGVGAMGSGC